jgi:hypothetical protein
MCDLPELKSARIPDGITLEDVLKAYVNAGHRGAQE